LFEAHLGGSAPSAYSKSRVRGSDHNIGHKYAGRKLVADLAPAPHRSFGVRLRKLSMQGVSRESKPVATRAYVPRTFRTDDYNNRTEMAAALANIRLKRAYEPPSEEDGARVLVDRLWPRGLTKEELHATAWLRDLAPSNQLRKWFHANPD